MYVYIDYVIENRSNDTLYIVYVYINQTNVSNCYQSYMFCYMLYDLVHRHTWFHQTLFYCYVQYTRVSYVIFHITYRYLLIHVHVQLLDHGSITADRLDINDFGRIPHSRNSQDLDDQELQLSLPSIVWRRSCYQDMAMIHISSLADDPAIDDCR